MRATFDLDNRVTSVSYPGGLIGSEAVGYDSVGNPLWTQDGNGQYTLYHYDNFNRLDAVKYSGALTSPYDGQSPSPDVSIGYELDSAGQESCTNLSVFRDLRSGHGVMMRMPIGRPLRKSRNGAA